MYVAVKYFQLAERFPHFLLHEKESEECQLCQGGALTSFVFFGQVSNLLQVQIGDQKLCFSEKVKKPTSNLPVQAIHEISARYIV